MDDSNFNNWSGWINDSYFNKWIGWMDDSYFNSYRVGLWIIVSLIVEVN